MNGYYIRQMEKYTLSEVALPFLRNANVINDRFMHKYKDRYPDMVYALREKFDLLTELPELFKIFTEFNENLEDDALELLKLTTSKSVLESFIDAIAGKESLTVEEYKQITTDIQKNLGVKGKALFMVLRVGITGITKGADLDKIATLLYVDDIVSRIDKCLKIMDKLC